MSKFITLIYQAEQSYDDLIETIYDYKTVKNKGYEIAEIIASELWSHNEKEFEVNHVKLSIDVDRIEYQIEFVEQFSQEEFLLAQNNVSNIKTFVLHSNNENEIVFTLDSFIKL